MRPFKFLLLSALFYVTLLTVFGHNQPPTEPVTTAPHTAPIVYNPITAPPATIHTGSIDTATIRTTLPVTTTSVEPSSTTAPSTSMVPLVGPDIPCQEWVPEAVEAGWPADRQVLETLMSVMWRESRCDPAALSKSSDHGLLQVNEVHRAYVEQIYGVPFEVAMADPTKNLHFAWLLYSELEASGRCGWAPWSLTCQ